MAPVPGYGYKHSESFHGQAPLRTGWDPRDLGVGGTESASEGWGGDPRSDNTYVGRAGVSRSPGLLTFKHSKLRPMPGPLCWRFPLPDLKYPPPLSPHHITLLYSLMTSLSEFMFACLLYVSCGWPTGSVKAGTSTVPHPTVCLAPQTYWGINWSGKGMDQWGAGGVQSMYHRCPVGRVQGGEEGEVG